MCAEGCDHGEPGLPRTCPGGLTSLSTSRGCPALRLWHYRVAPNHRPGETEVSPQGCTGSAVQPQTTYRHPRRSRELFLHTPTPSTRKTSCKFSYQFLVTSLEQGFLEAKGKKILCKEQAVVNTASSMGAATESSLRGQHFDLPCLKRALHKLVLLSSRKPTFLAKHGRLSCPQHLTLRLLCSIFTAAGAPSPARAHSPGVGSPASRPGGQQDPTPGDRVLLLRHPTAPRH